MLVREKGVKIIILTDRNISARAVPFPSVLSLSAVHHHLIKKGLRTECSIIVETGEAREVHHFCVLAGYGAEAVYPYLALSMVKSLALGLKHESQNNYSKYENNCKEK